MPAAKDSLGIRYGGAVLNGRVSVLDGLRRGCLPSSNGAEVHGRVLDYDPVLRAHCRLPEGWGREPVRGQWNSRRASPEG